MGCGCLIGALVTTILILLLLALALLLWRQRAAREAEQALADLRASGEPASAADLEALYTLPKGVEDTTALWLAGVAPLDTKQFSDDAGTLPYVGSGEDKVPPPGQPWPDLEAAERLLEKYAESLKRLHQAADAGGAARYPCDFAAGVSALLPHISTLREGQRLLALEVQVRAHRGDWVGALDALETMHRLGESLEREPILVSQLLRVALHGMACDALESLLAEIDLPDEDLARLQAEMTATDFDEGLVRGLEGDRVLAITTIRNPGAMQQEAGGLALWGPLRDGNLVAYLRTMEKMVLAARKPLPQRLDAVEQVDEQAETELSQAPKLTQAGHLLGALMIPACKAVVTAAARGNANSRMAAAAIAVERFRRRHGRLPERLDELVPELLPAVPADPFDGRPLRYRVEEHGFVVYSIGPNRIDDGGRENEESPSEGDVPFRVEIPPE